MAETEDPPLGELYVVLLGWQPRGCEDMEDDSMVT